MCNLKYLFLVFYWTAIVRAYIRQYLDFFLDFKSFTGQNIFLWNLKIDISGTRRKNLKTNLFVLSPPLNLASQKSANSIFILIVATA